MAEIHGRWVLSVVEDDELMTPVVTGFWCNQCWKPGDKDMTECPHCGAQMEQEVQNERMDSLG